MGHQTEPRLLKKVFLAHGRQNKRQMYNNDLMWAAWKLIQRGGYAYLCYGNLNDSKYKFIIKIN